MTLKVMSVVVVPVVVEALAPSSEILLWLAANAGITAARTRRIAATAARTRTLATTLRTAGTVRFDLRLTEASASPAAP